MTRHSKPAPSTWTYPPSTRWDDTFLALGKGLRGIKALTADLDDWFRIGNKRRLGKHLWHNRRMFKRTWAIHEQIHNLFCLTDTNVEPASSFVLLPVSILLLLIMFSARAVIHSV